METCHDLVEYGKIERDIFAPLLRFVITESMYAMLTDLSQYLPRYDDDSDRLKRHVAHESFHEAFTKPLHYSRQLV